MIKAKLHNLLGILTILAVHGGCASAYNGLGPNLYVREPGEIAEQRERFHLEARAWRDGYFLGGKHYNTSSVMPIVADVSPPAASKMVWGSTYNTAGLVLAIAGIASYINAEPAKRCLTCVPTLLTIGGVGLFTFGNWKLQTGVREYNGRLEQAFQIQSDL